MLKKYKYYLLSLIFIILVGTLIYANYKSKETKEKAEAVERYVVPKEEETIILGTVAPIYSQIYKIEKSNNIQLDVVAKNESDIKKDDLLYKITNIEISNTIEQLSYELNKLVYTREENIKEKENSIENINQKIKTEKEKLTNLQNLNLNNEDININIADLETEKNRLVNKDAVYEIQQEINKICAEMEALKMKEITEVYSPCTGKSYIQDDGSTITIKIISSEYNIKSQVDQEIYAQIKKGTKGKAIMIATNDNFETEIIKKSEEPNFSENNNVNYEISLSIDNKVTYVNGYTVQISLNLDNGELPVPQEYIVYGEKENYVTIEKENEKIKQNIVIDKVEDGIAWVSSGVNANDILILDEDLSINE